ncbi:hypothetical protein BKN37_26915 [Mycobacterium talmoniae]|uniref:Uncharacterized protein n=1 Tax=Mycobacterium talmoniae TaxID=1858794 RepID=A0A1S1MI20_9MYCO|nr:hypothetical protein BKN37_26915 [Mycobacterium talmoniae]
MIWASARDNAIRKWAIGFALIVALVELLAVGLWYLERVQNEHLCSQGFVPCQDSPVEWRSWMPLVISLAIVGWVTFRINTEGARSWSQTVLDSGTQASSFLYVVAILFRMQPVILAFIGMSVLFFVGDSQSGESLLATCLLFLFLAALLPLPLLWLVVRFNQLGMPQKLLAVAYGIAPAVCIIALLSKLNSTHLLNVFHTPGGDSRYVALVVLFGSLFAYAVLGEILTRELHANLESLDYLTSSWARERIDPAPTLRELRRFKRSAHVVAVITAGIAIGFIPSAFHLPDVLGMIVGVGFVALVSYVDAKLASRHLD